MIPSGFETLNDDEIARLHNTFASNTSKKTSRVAMAQKGMVAKRDAIQDYKPSMPIAPTKQRYIPTQQPMLSQDNRSRWEQEVSNQIKADKAKNDNLYKNQHTWNWSAPFTNARTTKDNASAMYDFNVQSTAGALDMTPLGDLTDAGNVFQSAKSGNYGQAALGAGMLLLPNFIEKPLKALGRVGKDYVTIAKDMVGSPRRFMQARKSGTYPLTYKERRKYLEKAHRIGDATSAKVETANMNDYQYRSDNYPNVYHDIRPLEGTNTKYTFNSKTYRNFDNPNHSTGVNSRGWNINSHINLRESPDSKFLVSAGTIQQNVAHEAQHSYQNSLPDLALMADRRTRVNGNKVVNEDFITSDALTPLKAKAGTWEGSPTELNSEMMSIRTGLNAPRYNLMTLEQQSKAKGYIGGMFRLDENTAHKMLNELGKLGYKNGGKL